MSLPPTPSSARRLRRPGGFTLVEVLAAIVIMALVIPAAMRGITIAARAGELAKHRTEASALASSKLQEIVSTQLWENGGTLSGDFTQEGYDQYTWEAELVQWNQPGFAPNDIQPQTLQQLNLKVTWNSGKRIQTMCSSN